MTKSKTNNLKARLRKIIKRVFCGALVLMGLGLALAWFVGGRLIAPANTKVGPPPSDLKLQVTVLASQSGSQIATWYSDEGDTKATIILLHPLRGNRRSMLTRARLFRDAGFSVVLIDMQAHGESPGDNITVGFQESRDVAAAVAFVKNLRPNNKIGIVGWSLGGAATLLSSPLDIDAIVLESVYPTINEAVHNRVSMRLGPLAIAVAPMLTWQIYPRLGISTGELRPIDRIAQTGCPVLVAAGDEDLHTPLNETQSLFEKACEPKKLAIFEGASHQDLYGFNRDFYKQEVLAFLKIHLLDGSGP